MLLVDGRDCVFLKGIEGEGEGGTSGHQRGIWLFSDVGCAEECGCAGHSSGVRMTGVCLDWQGAAASQFLVRSDNLNHT